MTETPAAPDHVFVVEEQVDETTSAFLAVGTTLEAAERAAVKNLLGRGHLGSLPKWTKQSQWCEDAPPSWYAARYSMTITRVPLET